MRRERYTVTGPDLKSGLDLDRLTVRDELPVDAGEQRRVDDSVAGDPVDDQLTDLLLGVVNHRSRRNAGEAAAAGLPVVVDRHDELRREVDRCPRVGQVDDPRSRTLGDVD